MFKIGDPVKLRDSSLTTLFSELDALKIYTIDAVIDCSDAFLAGKCPEPHTAIHLAGESCQNIYDSSWFSPA